MSRWHSFKEWMLYGPIMAIFVALPSECGWWFRKACRRWVYGPNANYEDLHEIVELLLSNSPKKKP